MCYAWFGNHIPENIYNTSRFLAHTYIRVVRHFSISLLLSTPNMHMKCWSWMRSHTLMLTSFVSPAVLPSFPQLIFSAKLPCQHYCTKPRSSLNIADCRSIPKKMPDARSKLTVRMCWECLVEGPVRMACHSPNSQHFCDFFEIFF